jgi:hypothetical protein
MLGKLQVIGPVPLHEPELGVATGLVIEPGNVIVNVAPVAACGPLFVIVKVVDVVPLRGTGSGDKAVAVVTRSAIAGFIGTPPISHRCPPPLRVSDIVTLAEPASELLAPRTSLAVAPELVAAENAV